MTYTGGCEVCGKRRCECPPRLTVLKDVRAYAFGDRFKRRKVQLAASCNLRFSVTSPSPALLNALNGELTVRQLVFVMRTTSHFHAHVLHEGKGVFYETHTLSLAAGLEAHRNHVQQVHAHKSSNANLCLTTYCMSGSGAAVVDVYGVAQSFQNASDTTTCDRFADRQRER